MRILKNIPHESGSEPGPFALPRLINIKQIGIPTTFKNQHSTFNLSWFVKVSDNLKRRINDIELMVTLHIAMHYPTFVYPAIRGFWSPNLVLVFPPTTARARSLRDFPSPIPECISDSFAVVLECHKPSNDICGIWNSRPHGIKGKKAKVLRNKWN